MGLDMYLYGEKSSMAIGANAPTEDGFRLASKTLEIAYWRKHPNLHGYIVETFADGVDECQPINLHKEEINKIIEAIKNDELPFTEGFFFGRSPQKGEPEYEENKQHDIEVFEKALKWLGEQTEEDWRYIKYEASW
jgi:beta-xylosidase